MEEMTIREFVKRFANGDFKSKDKATQCEAGWYDWWCSTRALANKTEILGKKVVSIQDSPRFDKDKTYVFFKNNCPCVGKLYDQFSICDLESGDVLFCCQHLERGSHGCERAHWEIYARENGFNKPVVSGGWSTCQKWFNNK